MVTCVTGKPMSLYTASSEWMQSVWYCFSCIYFSFPLMTYEYRSQPRTLCLSCISSALKKRKKMFQRCKFPVHLKKAREKEERYKFRKASSEVHILLDAREPTLPSVCLCWLHLSREIPLKASRTPQIWCSQDHLFNRNSSASSLGFTQIWSLEISVLGVWVIAIVLIH